MNPRDYIVSVDEHGDPYISHALFGLGKGGQKKNHKYYTRAQDNGRWRYFYSPEEYRTWASGGSKKKVSTSDKMKTAFRQLKEAGTDAAVKVRDKVAPQHKERLDAAEKKLRKAEKDLLDNNRRADTLKKDWFEAQKKFNDYDASMFKKYGKDYKSKMSAAEKNKHKEYHSDLSEKAEAGWNAAVVQPHSGTDSKRPTLKDKVNSAKREYDDEADYSLKEFAKDAASNIKDKIKDKLKSRADDRDEKSEKESAVRPSAHQRPEAVEQAKEGSMKRRTTEKSKYGEYKKGDSDFDDDNYKEENRVGDTDFFVHRRRDGTNVILEEDMKWVLPKGVDGSSPAIQKAIKDFASHVESARKLGEKYTATQWTEEVTKAIDDAVRNTPISGTKSGSEEPYLSEEYLKRLEFNSKKNKY